LTGGFCRLVTIDWAAIAAAAVENDVVTTAQVRPFVQRAQGPLRHPLGRHLAWRLGIVLSMALGLALGLALAQG